MIDEASGVHARGGTKIYAERRHRLEKQAELLKIEEEEEEGKAEEEEENLERLKSFQ